MQRRQAVSNRAVEIETFPSGDAASASTVAPLRAKTNTSLDTLFQQRAADRGIHNNSSQEKEESAEAEDAQAELDASVPSLVKPRVLFDASEDAGDDEEEDAVEGQEDEQEEDEQGEEEEAEVDEAEEEEEAEEDQEEESESLGGGDEVGEGLEDTMPSRRGQKAVVKPAPRLMDAEKDFLLRCEICNASSEHVMFFKMKEVSWTSISFVRSVVRHSAHCVHLCSCGAPCLSPFAALFLAVFSTLLSVK
jgi:hypothetical protein